MPETAAKTPRRHERSDARRLAMQLMYQSEILSVPVADIIEKKIHIEEEGLISPYAQRLVEGYQAHRIEIDDLLENSSENWSLTRMPMVDRALLRLITFEMLYVEEVPISVSINEAVELAKEFGGEDDSHRFVNGILGKIAIILEERSAQNPVACTTPAEAEAPVETPAHESGEQCAASTHAPLGDIFAPLSCAADVVAKPAEKSGQN